MQSFLRRNKLPWQQESLANTPYIFALVSHIRKTEFGEPNFLLHKSDQQAKMKISAKFKKILWRGFRGTLNFQLFKVADYISEIKNGDHRVCFWDMNS